MEEKSKQEKDLENQRKNYPNVRNVESKNEDKISFLNENLDNNINNDNYGKNDYTQK